MSDGEPGTDDRTKKPKWPVRWWLAFVNEGTHAPLPCRNQLNWTTDLN
jgi:hypothetical protein